MSTLSHPEQAPSGHIKPMRGRRLRFYAHPAVRGVRVVHGRYVDEHGLTLSEAVDWDAELAALRQRELLAYRAARELQLLAQRQAYKEAVATPTAPRRELHEFQANIGRAILGGDVLRDPLLIVRRGLLAFTSVMVGAAVAFSLSHELIGFLLISLGFIAWGFVGIVDTAMRGRGAVQDPRLSTLMVVGGVGTSVTVLVAWLT